MPRQPLLNCLPHLRRAAMLDGGGLTDGQLLGEFIRNRDENAFASLVRRHASMVFGVCRRLIGDVQIAEDAFQAVFLVLAQRAASIRPREQVGNWLYGVAYRVALRSKAQFARLRSKEKQVSVMPHPEVLPNEIWRDVQAVLDEELARLPDKLRVAVVLCDLEGRPQRETARQLSLPLATLANRLASARRLLADRLSKRGIVLSGGALATTIAARAAQASVPPLLVAAAARIASSASGGAAKIISAQVVQLSEGVMKMMLLGKLRTLTCCLLATFLLAGVGFQIAAQAADEPTRPAPVKAPVATAIDKPKAKPNETRLDDREYLRRICLDMRGDLPTLVELPYFVADTDPLKRSKVVEWLIAEKDAKAAQRILQFQELMRLADQRIEENYVKRGVDLSAKIRRNYFDFFGVPPTPEEVKKYTDRKSKEPREKSADWLTEDDKAIEDAILEWIGVEDDLALTVGETDETFLRRVCLEARKSEPTRLETEYFKADMDPKKREKLLDLFVRDPAFAKTLGEDWKRKMLQPAVADSKLTKARWFARYQVLLLRNRDKDVPARLDKLLDQLLKEKRTDEQMLEALSTATVGRLPTESEKKLALANVAKQSDKKTAWREVLKTFASTNEAKQHANELNPPDGTKKTEKQ